MFVKVLGTADIKCTSEWKGGLLKNVNARTLRRG